MDNYTSYPITLIGNTVVDTAGTTQVLHATIETGHGKHGTILDLSASTNPKYANVPQHTLTDNQVIFPGFLNLHSHVAWNFIPFWLDPSNTVWDWDNRFEWQADASYKTAVVGIEDYIQQGLTDYANQQGVDPTILISAFSEIQAVCGGTTMIQETSKFNKQDILTNKHILIRSTGDPDDIEIGAPQFIDSVVKFFKPSPPAQPVRNRDTSGWKVVQNYENFDDYLSNLQQGKVYSALVHLSVLVPI